MSIFTSNTIFIHAPKTGGTWVAKTLKDMGLVSRKIGHTHDCVRVLEKKCKEDLSEYTKFVTIRHPLSWVISIWSHWNIAKGCRASNKRNLRSGKHWSYNTFSPAMLRFITGDINKTLGILASDYPSFVSNMFLKYLEGVDVIIKQECLREGLMSVLKNAGEEFDSRIIVSSKKENVYGESNRHNVRLDKDAVENFIGGEEAFIERFSYSRIPKDLMDLAV